MGSPLLNMVRVSLSISMIILLYSGMGVAAPAVPLIPLKSSDSKTRVKKVDLKAFIIMRIVFYSLNILYG